MYGQHDLIYIGMNVNVFFSLLFVTSCLNMESSQPLDFCAIYVVIFLLGMKRTRSPLLCSTSQKLPNELSPIKC